MQEVCKLLLGFLAEAGTENSKSHMNKEQSLDYLILKEEGEKGIWIFSKENLKSLLEGSFMWVCSSETIEAKLLHLKFECHDKILHWMEGSLIS